jgi:hypothetical protein
LSCARLATLATSCCSFSGSCVCIAHAFAVVYTHIHAWCSGVKGIGACGWLVAGQHARSSAHSSRASTCTQAA